MQTNAHPIFADSPVPLYSQLADLLRQRILRGVWRPGEKVPSLDALVEEFQVARLAGRAVLMRWDRRRRWRGRGRHGAAAGGLRNAHKSATAHPAHGTLQSL
jgi:GntR family transcriptional regulator